MEAYTGFAQVYDMFMDNVPYEQWSGYLISLLKSYGVSDGLVLDLGCGTGKMTRLLFKAGYDMIGVDSSEEMLEIATEAENEEKSGLAAVEENKEKSGLAAVEENEEKSGLAAMAETDGNTGLVAERVKTSILYLCQDMREFELYGTVAAVVSVCDSMNYILEEEELLTVFKLVNNYLDPGGVFIFDLNTLYKYRELLGENTICENREEASFIWENFYDEEEQINEYDLTLFVREESGLYRKLEETHFQRGYELLTVRRLLETAGMEYVTAYDAFTMEKPREDSERIYVIAREKGKERK